MNKQNLIDSRNCPNKFWKSIKTNKTYKSITSKIEPNAWYQYFKELLCPQNKNETEHIDDNLLADIRQNNDSADLNCIIADEEVRKSIAHLHANKSPGPDGLPAIFFNVLWNLRFRI